MVKVTCKLMINASYNQFAYNQTKTLVDSTEQFILLSTELNDYPNTRNKPFWYKLYRCQ